MALSLMFFHKDKRLVRGRQETVGIRIVEPVLMRDEAQAKFMISGSERVGGPSELIAAEVLWRTLEQRLVTGLER